MDTQGMIETAASTVAFSTLGCKVNYSESEALARQFLARGYHIVPFEEAADVYVVNTCTVTHVADRPSVLRGAERTTRQDASREFARCRSPSRRRRRSTAPICCSLRH